MIKNVCFLTSTRADYSLLKPLLLLFKRDAEINLQLIVTGSHLSEKFGNTYKAIEEDGFYINKKIYIVSEDSKIGIGKSMGMACTGYSEAFSEISPDILVLLGDRYETFIAAGIATVFNITLAHIHGGEITNGAIDDAFRNSITQMSDLHFAATEEYGKRIAQMKVNPDNIYCTGSLAVDSVKSIPLLSLEETEKRLKTTLQKSILFTYHPQTRGGITIEEQAEEVFGALEQLNGVHMILTKSNADAGGMYINHCIDNFVESHPETAVAYDSLGQLLYYSAMKYCGAVVGNSSSGILETPIFKTPCVNIGDRQKGRITADNIINAECHADDIVKKINKALSLAFKNSVMNITNPFEAENTADVIYHTIKKFINNCQEYPYLLGGGMNWQGFDFFHG